MSDYRNVLIATDFSEGTEQVAAHALSIAEKYQASILLLHVVDSLPIADAGYGPIMPLEVDFTEQMVEVARRRLTDLAARLGLDAEACRIEVGNPQHEIVRTAQDAQCDLIVVGSHGRRGLALLLGSTATAVLHHAKCDVLAVRINA